MRVDANLRKRELARINIVSNFISPALVETELSKVLYICVAGVAGPPQHYPPQSIIKSLTEVNEEGSV